VPPLFAVRFVSRDGKSVALYAVPAGSFWETEVADRFSEDVRAVDPEASGLAMVHVAHGLIILQGFRRAALIAAAVIVVLLLVDFRSLRDSMLALLPTVLGWLWMLAAMSALSIEFNVANIVALPLVLGIGIAFGVHVMHRQRETDHPRIDDVIRGTGGAIFVAATTTMVGFAALTLSDYGGMRSLGIVMVIGIGTCLLATIFVLPAVLLLLRRSE
jgi:predicted RND superfamily exporter protein